MPDISGVELLRNLGDHKINIPLDRGYRARRRAHGGRGHESGSRGFHRKTFRGYPDHRGNVRASEHLVLPEADADEANDIRARLQTLSERERQVLSAVVAGLPNKSIAYDLDISPRTVEVHRANLAAKMKPKSLPHLVRMALATGFGPS
ncbi:DNA-binding response regulator [Sinorhizobium meliloti]|nr:DNA-binding response regulator [Sinorhizobium meliloti]